MDDVESSYALYVAWFNEYSHVHRDKRGVPINTVYFYECYQFPDYYVRWYCDQSTVDCEVTTCNHDRKFS